MSIVKWFWVVLQWLGLWNPSTSVPAGNSHTIEQWALDNPLLQLSPADTLTQRHVCEGIQIFGGTGSGKTSASGAHIARAFLRAGFGGLVMCAKPEERRLWEQYAKETGRE